MSLYSKVSRRVAEIISPLACGKWTLNGKNENPLKFESIDDLVGFHFSKNSSEDHPCRQSRLGESGQNDEWIFCLTAARIAA